MAGESTTLSSIALRSSAAGIVAGVSALPIIMPFRNLQLASQVGRPLRSFRATEGVLRVCRQYYRGTGAQGGSFVVSRVMEIVANRLVVRRVEERRGEKLSRVAKLGVAWGAGLVSALPKAITESVLVRVSTGATYTRALRDITRGRGIEGPVLAATTLRMSFFTLAYLGEVPVVHEILVKRGFSERQSTLLSGVGVGTSYSVITHPIETFRVCYVARKAIRFSIRAAFNGFLPRLIVNTFLTVMIPPIRKFIEGR